MYKSIFKDYLSFYGSSHVNYTLVCPILLLVLDFTSEIAGNLLHASLGLKGNS